MNIKNIADTMNKIDSKGKWVVCDYPGHPDWSMIVRTEVSFYAEIRSKTSHFEMVGAGRLECFDCPTEEALRNVFKKISR